MLRILTLTIKSTLLQNDICTNKDINIFFIIMVKKNFTVILLVFKDNRRAKE